MLEKRLASQASLPSAGDLVGRYEVVAPIAEGGMAGVFVVRLGGMAGFEKLLAMKVLLPHLRKDRQFVDMFLDEARIAAAVHHPNVIEVFDLGEHDGAPFLVMEYLRGRSLREVVKKGLEANETLPLSTLLHILARAAEGLHAAHETRDGSGRVLGVVHRDVSPHNIHVGFDGVVKVLDFGIAAAHGRYAETRSGEIKGKFQYAAPEQITREVPVDRRTDVWALGVVAYEILAGVRPFHGEDDATTLWNVIHKEVTPLRLVAPSVPAEVAAIVDGCLQRTRTERPATALEVAEQLDHHAQLIGGGGAAGVRETLAHLFEEERAREQAQLDDLPASSAPRRASEASEVSEAHVDVLVAGAGFGGRGVLFGVAMILSILAISGAILLWTNASDNDATRTPVDEDVDSVSPPPASTEASPRRAILGTSVAPASPPVDEAALPELEPGTQNALPDNPTHEPTKRRRPSMRSTRGMVASDPTSPLLEDPY